MPTVQPKPTKTEIVEAMLVRAKVKHDAENERRKQARQAITKKVESEALKALKADKTLKPSISVQNWNTTVQMSYLIDTPEIRKMLEEKSRLGSLVWDEKVTRKTIREELECRHATRLLDDPEAVKAIDAMLESWGM